MKFCYRGVSYKYNPSQQTVTQLVQMLCYRGVFHIREIRSSDSKQISTVEHSQNDGTQSDVGYRSFEQQNQRMGLLYRLYCTGWRNGSLRFLPTLQHWVLNIFLDYRKGYAEGAKWRQQHL